MIEITPKHFLSLQAIYSQTHFGVLSAGTLEGGHPGRVFVDNLRKPASALVSTRVGYYFLAGNPDNQEVLASIHKLFCEDLGVKQIKALDDPQILLFYEPIGWKTKLLELFIEYKPRTIYKKRMVLSEGYIENYLSRKWQDQIPEGIRLVPITAELLSLHPVKAETIKLFWGTIPRFLKKSLGFWLMVGETIASSCEAVFIGAGEAEISISTMLEFRRRGLARLAASAFITTCLECGLTPIWGCWPENQPSVALAKSLGFQDDIEQEICFFEFSDQT